MTYALQVCYAQAKSVMDKTGSWVEGGGEDNPAVGSQQLAREERDLLLPLLRLRQACCHLQVRGCFTCNPTPPRPSFRLQGQASVPRLL